MQAKVKTISFQGQNIYIGIDAHLKRRVAQADGVSQESFIFLRPKGGELSLRNQQS